MLTEDHTSTVHQVGEISCEHGIQHGFVPIMCIILRLPIRWFSGVENFDET
jgi:hypothetical protein